MRVVVIGGTGHIGSYLIPMLVEAGHSVTCVCRGVRKPYREHSSWAEIKYLSMDRAIEEGGGSFGERVAAVKAEIVIDLTCYHLHSVQQLAEAIKGRVEHLLHCGTIWVHGPSSSVPTTEDQPRRPFGEYGIRKAAIEKWLIGQAHDFGLPVTILHPGHLVGPGWAPINPVGNFNTEIFAALSRGLEVRIPNFGMETLQHVHAEDVARAFLLAIGNRNVALGHSFHIVAGSALTFRGYAEEVASWFDRPPRLAFLPWGEWKLGVTEKDAAVTEDHLRHSPHCSVLKAQTLLKYQPRYTPLASIQESVRWLMEHGNIARS